jgi:hypothetical protein
MAARKPLTTSTRRSILAWLVTAAFVIVYALVHGSSPALPPIIGGPPIGPRDGACAVPPVPAAPIACPYLGQAGPTDDPAAAFAGYVGITCLAAGDLVMPTGELTASDPLTMLITEPFTATVPPGRYPVVLARTDDRDVALALLLVQPARPTRWETAFLASEDPAAGTPRYGVDSGTGCYADRVVAERIRDAQDYEELFDLLYAAGYDKNPAANLCVDPATGASLVVFSSGAGDGSYPVFVGYAADGRVAAFATDFEVLPHDTADSR